MKQHLGSALIVALAGLAGMTAVVPRAHADLISLRAQVQGGIAEGEGVSGDRKAEAFAANAPSEVLGVLVGVEVAFLDVWISHDQFRGDDRTATWTAAALGFDVEFPLGDVLYAGVGLAGGGGLGTGQQIVPPLDAAQLSDKGVFGQAHGELGVKLGAGFRVGLLVPYTYGYYLKTGDGDFANDETTHYTATQLQILVNVGWKLELL